MNFPHPHPPQRPSSDCLRCVGTSIPSKQDIAEELYTELHWYQEWARVQGLAWSIIFVSQSNNNDDDVSVPEFGWSGERGVHRGGDHHNFKERCKKAKKVPIGWIASC